jgi:hypothetical protein
MNPDLKVYVTTISIEGVHDWLKPGMSAKVEIKIDRLTNVVYVPIQAVFPEEGNQVCYIDRRNGRERRLVEIGESNDEFIEIKSGLKEGERICLRSPQLVPLPGEDNGKEKEDSEKPSRPPIPTPQPGVVNPPSPAAAPAGSKTKAS